jgi:lipooligosaccharide transport system permease protein
MSALRGRAVVERNLRASKRFWLILLSGFAEPLFYLFGIGVGLGQLVGEVTASGVEVTYAQFVAPALLATSAMNGAVQEATNVFFKFRYAKTYHAMLATPLGPLDVVLGEVLWSQIRALLYSAVFLAVVAVLGFVPSPLGLLALPAALLVGFAFAAAGVAMATFMRSYLDFDLVQLVSLPLFLFSATFFPLDVYPAALRPLVQLSPLYHAVALVRSLTLGVLEPELLGHVAFLAALGVLGLVTARRRLGRLLLD